MLEKQVEVRQREVVELQSQVQALSREGKDAEEVDGRRQLLEKKFQELLEPLQQRRNLLLASREVHQFNRDVEDEIVSSAAATAATAPPLPWGRGRGQSLGDVTNVFCLLQLWVQERMGVATSTEHGCNLQTVQLLIKKKQVSS